MTLLMEHNNAAASSVDVSRCQNRDLVTRPPAVRHHVRAREIALQNRRRVRMHARVVT